MKKILLGYLRLKSEKDLFCPDLCSNEIMKSPNRKNLSKEDVDNKINAKRFCGKKLQSEQVTYVGYFDNKPKKLDDTKYKLCPSCNGSGESDDEFPVRCFKCCGDGYIHKNMS